MLTARRATPSTSWSGLESGADDYVVKPFKPKELVARMRARLRPYDDDDAGDARRSATSTIDVAGHSVDRGTASRSR